MGSERNITVKKELMNSHESVQKFVHSFFDEVTLRNTTVHSSGVTCPVLSKMSSGDAQNIMNIAPEPSYES